MVTLGGLGTAGGAMYSPLELILPLAAPPSTAQLTVWFELLPTVALKKARPLTATVVVLVLTEMVTGGGVLPPPQEISASRAAITMRKRTRRCIQSAPRKLFLEFKHDFKTYHQIPSHWNSTMRIERDSLLMGHARIRIEASCCSLKQDGTIRCDQVAVRFRNRNARLKIPREIVTLRVTQRCFEHRLASAE